MEYGVNHIDTAASYGKSELRIGPWMEDHRNDFFLATKTGERSYEQAKAETARCLHCDCRKAQDCKLRDYSKDYSARPGRYKAERRLFEQYTQHAEIIYEPGKCIDCGLCVQIASEAGESLGLTFIGRGFDVRVAVPFDHSIAEGFKTAGRQCVKACPTGALAFK